MVKKSAGTLLKWCSTVTQWGTECCYLPAFLNQVLTLPLALKTQFIFDVTCAWRGPAAALPMLLVVGLWPCIRDTCLSVHSALLT